MTIMADDQVASPEPVRTIRPLVAADIGALQAIDRHAHGEAWSRRTFLDEVDGSHRVHLVVEVDGVVVGHASAWLDNGIVRVTNVAIGEEHTGCGHASAALLEVLRRAMTENFVARVQLEVRPANRRAQRLYGRFGFVPVGVHRDFYDRADESGSTDAVVMVVADHRSPAWSERLERLDRSANAGAAR